MIICKIQIPLNSDHQCTSKIVRPDAPRYPGLRALIVSRTLGYLRVPKKLIFCMRFLFRDIKKFLNF